MLPEPGQRQRVISLEQSLLNRNPVRAGENKRVVSLGPRWAEVWDATDGAGNPVVLVAWEEMAYGTSGLLFSTETEERL